MEAASRLRFYSRRHVKNPASVYGTPVTNGPDGYIDLADVQVTQAQNELMYLEVNTINGQTKIKNQSGKTFHIDEYTIRSAAGGQTGDYNNNGVVDAADYVLWRNGGTLQNDPTPGVQPGDYAVWRANFGKTGGSLNAAAWTSLQDQNLAGFPSGNGTATVGKKMAAAAVSCWGNRISLAIAPWPLERRSTLEPRLMSAALKISSSTTALYRTTA